MGKQKKRTDSKASKEVDIPAEVVLSECTKEQLLEKFRAARNAQNASNKNHKKLFKEKDAKITNLQKDLKKKGDEITNLQTEVKKKEDEITKLQTEVENLKKRKDPEGVREKEKVPSKKGTTTVKNTTTPTSIPKNVPQRFHGKEILSLQEEESE